MWITHHRPVPAQVRAGNAVWTGGGGVEEHRQAPPVEAGGPRWRWWRRSPGPGPVVDEGSAVVEEPAPWALVLVLVLGLAVVEVDEVDEGPAVVEVAGPWALVLVPVEADEGLHPKPPG